MTGFAAGLWETMVAGARLAGPQMFLTFAATVMLWPADLFVEKGRKHIWAPITMAILAVAGILVYLTPAGAGFSDMYKVDGLTKGFQALILLAAFLAVLLSQKLLDGLREQTVEYYALILFSLVGMLTLVGSTDLMTVYFSIELMALCVYILVAYLRDQHRGVEAGLKYFLLGAFSSGILLYGMSLVFAAVGGATTNLAELNRLLPVVPKSSNLLVFSGVLMVLVGLCFKVAAVPFHMWSPDAYEGAPTPITAFMATAPKVAAMGAFLRVFGTGFAGVSGEWMLPLSYVAGASMILGNIAAVRQQTMKRLLAYSSIAHVGYMLLGVLGRGVDNAQAVWLYLLTYLVMNTGAFAVVIILQGKGEGERIEDFRGLGKRRPFLAFAMMMFLLSLAGIPPLVGFFGKFYLFKLAVESDLVALVTVALITSAISAFYYLQVVNQMYFKEPAPLPEGAEEGAEPEALGTAMTLIVGAACVLTLVGTFAGYWLVEKIIPRISWI
jgi:NADH-quinone oxidoreductase subunit N